MELNEEYIPGSSYLVDHCVKELDAEITGIEDNPDNKPPFPCLTGASNTSNSYRIEKESYPNIVAVGVDTLELNFGVSKYRYPDMFKKLDESKLIAANSGYKGNRGVSIGWFGNEFMVQARGSKGGYEYILRNGDIDLQIMPEAKGGNPSPELRVIFHSPYLWHKGDIQAYNEVINYLNEWVMLEYCKVSRADLCADRLMPLPELNRKTQVVTRLRDKNLYYGGDFISGQRDTGYQFGRGDIACRFYDKTYEIKSKGKGHIFPLWIDNGWDEKSPVSRLEYQIRREGLRLFDKNMDFVTFQDTKADIWSYGTDKYLRIVDPDTATRKERAKVTEYWEEYQDCAWLFGERRGVLPYKQIGSDYKPLIDQSNGCLASALARLAADVGKEKAISIIEKECRHEIPRDIIEDALLQKARFMHMN